MQDVRGRELGQRRDQRPAHQRPVREDQRRVASPVTCEPKSSSANVVSAPNAASSVNRWLRAAAADAGRVTGPDREVDEQPDQQHRRGQVGRDRLAGVAEADRLATEPGLEADEHDGAQRRPEDASAGRDGRRRARTPGPGSRTRRATATSRWIHSIQAFGSSSGGMSWPWQSGQSGQPSPESVARTTTPIVTSRSVVTRVAAASFWKRVTRRPF